MKKKINLRLLGLSAIAIFTTAFILLMLFYNLFLNQVEEELETYANLIERVGVTEEFFENIYVELVHGMRVTIIAEDGTVIYDTKAQAQEMENHSNRDEVLEANQYGEGFDMRTSETVGMNTFYYAKKQVDGSFLRIAKESESVGSIILDMVPTVICLLIIVYIITIIISTYLAKSFVRPIENLAEKLDQPDTEGIDEELIPFIRKIKNQHKDILKSAIVRQEFTANVSHELKTPLTSISGYAELIETGMASPEDITRFANGIHKSANRLLSLINDIIRLSELDAEQIEEVKEIVDLYEHAQNCVDSLQVNAKKHNIKIILKGRTTKIYSNKQMVDEVLYNLIGNAIRYNKENGSVIITTVPCGDKGMLVVEDTGIGIPKQHQERIFERFYRVDKGRSKSTGGTGLGLAIVKHIIQTSQAQLELESEEGVGTKITVFYHIE